MWLGPYQHEATAAYKRARESGLSLVRAFVVGMIASHRDCWAFRRTIAAKVGCSVRTVQRAITQAKAEGLLKTWRCKKTEKPPAYGTIVPCGWSHRVIIGWGLAGHAIKGAIAAARASFLVRSVARTEKRAERRGDVQTLPRGARGSYVFRRGDKPRRTWTADELAAELAELDRRKPPD
jgi:hypothetical protein